MASEILCLPVKVQSRVYLGLLQFEDQMRLLHFHEKFSFSLKTFELVSEQLPSPPPPPALAPSPEEVLGLVLGLGDNCPRTF